ncbi:1,2-phenylacetyl-CoA epoxidase subunit PaaD [Sphingobium sp. AP50]|uniref:1,2-phenylacetyl-CoA epoxidase subunit PaaD n=1 Tax=Sphingobium sp. AP50 TaxID=1884369 RepID=UPI000B89679B|nr:1,2-phenylacetyl-CoA epoxidase subunit PaaD [Sphingobium sp. AP50]
MHAGDISSPSFEDRVRDVLCDVPDPEIPAISVVELGIVRAIECSPPTVLLTPTYSGCPATLVIEQAVRHALDHAGFGEVGIRTVLSPPWTTDWISDAGREKLKAYGIAPPPRGASMSSLRNREAAACPRCGSAATHEVSRFGSTPCKALWQCEDCLEPFDRFKCH